MKSAQGLSLPKKGSFFMEGNMLVEGYSGLLTEDDDFDTEAMADHVNSLLTFLDVPPDGGWINEED